jgi:hypothetical protein
MSYSLYFRRQVFKIKEQETLAFQGYIDRLGVQIRTRFAGKGAMEPKAKQNKPALK